MRYVSDYISGACDCCKNARKNRNDDWYCSKNEDDFPEADWNGSEEYEPSSCPSFRPDPGCIDSEDWIW